MKKTKKTKKSFNIKEKLPLLIIGSAAVVTFVLVFTFTLQGQIWDSSVQEIKSHSFSRKETRQQPVQFTSKLENLPKDEKLAIDSEIANMEKDLDSVSEVNMDDLSNVENSL